MPSLFSKAIIIVYIGKFNCYFDLWLESCKYQKSYTFFLFTDDKTYYSYPSNVKVFYYSFDEIKNIIQASFDFPIVLDRPYKLCDYKVAYGDVFSDYIKGYDYWGYCDLDVIFGNLDNFYTDSLICQFDKISSCGHFTLYKNNHMIRRYYQKKIEGLLYYKDVFSNPSIFYFDEYGNGRGINYFFIRREKGLFEGNLLPADIKVGQYGLRTTKEVYSSPDIIKKEKQKNKIYYFFSSGTLCQFYSISFNKTFFEEVPYIHLQKRKMKNKTTVKESFFIIPPNKFVSRGKNNVLNKLRLLFLKDEPCFLVKLLFKIHLLEKPY